MIRERKLTTECPPPQPATAPTRPHRIRAASRPLALRRQRSSTRVCYIGREPESARETGTPSGPALRTYRTFIAGRRRGDSRDRSIMRTSAQPCARLESPRARVPYTAGCEISHPAVLRAAAQAKYSKRFRGAYGPHRSRAEAPHRTSTTKSPAPRTDQRRDGELPLTATFLAESRCGEYFRQSMH